MRNIVERLDLKRALADESTVAKLRMAGFRGNNPLTQFLFFRLVLPFVGLVLAGVYVFLLGGLPEQPFFIKIFVCIAVPMPASTRRSSTFPTALPSARRRSKGLAGRARPDADLRRIRHER
jgi:hypothetical protein